MIEEADFVNPEERLPEHELGADEPGRVRGRGGRQHALGGEDGRCEHEVERYADEPAEHLRAAGSRGKFRRLYLAAAPRFLGTLRLRLDEQTLALVVENFDKDLVRLGADEIHKHLPYRL